jgi:N6-L-threonylcarbamoyladenine synthase
MLIMGIDTACDDTGIGIVEDGHTIMSNIVWTQNRVHAKFGGVVPELAARRHAEIITSAIQEALDKAQRNFSDIDAIGVNCQHGLLRSIIVGVAASKAIAYARNIPLIGVHHIEAHIYSNLVKNPSLKFPFLTLTVSGGHNLLINCLDHGKYELIGRTLDDSAGEAFDKVAKLLGLGFPGGPFIEKAAANGNIRAFNFPRPMIDHENYDFSFSGLKTAVFTTVSGLRSKNDTINVSDLAASFQQAVIDVLVNKSIKAAINNNLSTIAVSGGVAANSYLKTVLSDTAHANGIETVFPEIALCTDNGVNVASLAYYKYISGLTSEYDMEAFASAPFGGLNMLYKKIHST